MRMLQFGIHRLRFYARTHGVEYLEYHLRRYTPLDDPLERRECSRCRVVARVYNRESNR